MNVSRLQPDDIKVKEIERIIADIPAHPSFKEAGGSTISKGDRAVVSKYYISSAAYDEVSKFYAAALRRQGWQPEGADDIAQWGVNYGGRVLSFRKGEFEIAIQYEGERATSNSRNYSISYGWQHQWR